MRDAAALPPAPFHAEIADGPPGGHAVWAHAGDGVRIRLGLWPLDGATARGTVLLFPGRTEYLEKYGRAARALQARGYAVIAADWRGQGLADRALADPMTGHVGRFAEHQQDVGALLHGAHLAGLPQPFHLLAHSMGGCIGLRALTAGLPVRSAAFSAPMWGIRVPQRLGFVAWALSAGAHSLAQGHRYVPSTGPVSYVLSADEDDNSLTSDPAMLRFMRDQIRAHPELALGGPSLSWLFAALRETRALRRLPAPGLPCHVTFGSHERVVDTASITARVDRWPGATLTIAEGAEHEVMMERPPLRQAFFDRACDLFDAAG